MSKDTIKKDTKITKDMVWLYDMPKELVNDKMFRSLKEVVGRTATETILPTQYISEEALDESILHPTADTEFFPIPSDWLVDLQGTLRRYDIVNISTVKDIDSKRGSNQSTVVMGASVKPDYVLKDIPVAFVKGSKNEEVTGVNSDEDRLYGTEKPSNIQLSLTLKQFKELEKLYLEGYRFVLSY